jgi:chromosome segregation ATPase
MEAVQSMDQQGKFFHVSTFLSRFSWLLVAGVGALAVGGLAVHQNNQIEQLHSQLAASQQDTAALHKLLGQSNSDLQTSVAELREQLEQNQHETTASLANAQTLASRHADQVAGRITRNQEEQSRRLRDELSQIRDSATEASTKLDGVSTQVGSVKTDLDSTRTDLAQTKADLLRTHGDLGEMSGLIATNAKQIQALRDLGDRNIYEFTIAKKEGAQKVADIQVTLEKTDPRRNRFSLQLLADDKRVDKKDRTINEPMTFYTAKARQPYELVVNEVQKDKVIGYLAIPKVTAARNTTPTSAR